MASSRPTASTPTPPTAWSSIRKDRLIACEGALFERPGVKVQGKPQITRTDLKTGKMEVLADNYQGKPFEGPNDVDARQQRPHLLHRHRR